MWETPQNGLPSGLSTTWVAPSRATAQAHRPTGQRFKGPAPKACKPAFKKGNKVCHQNTELARFLTPTVINVIHCFNISCREDGEFGKLGVVSQRTRISRVWA